MATFEWDKAKAAANAEKYGISFDQAKRAFDDPRHIIIDDLKHSAIEDRLICLAEVDGDIMTVRFTYRGKAIRIISVAYWRKGRKTYEEKRKKN